MNDIEINQVLGKRFALKKDDIDKGEVPDMEYGMVKIMRKEFFSIMDIGANCGISSYYFLKEQPFSNICAFEPNYYLMPYLSKVADAFPSRMKIYNFGLGIKNHTSNLFVPIIENDYYSGLGSLDKGYAIKSLLTLGINKENVCFDTISVEIKKGDEVELPMDCRIIKIDIEGAECDCLLGLKEFIKKVKPIILVETLYNKDNIYDILYELDYNPWLLYDNSVKYNLHHRNTIFVPNNNNWRSWLIDGCWFEEKKFV